VRSTVINFAYLLASILFILGLQGLIHPRTAVRGNLTGALGMLVALIATTADRRVLSFELILAGLIIGSAIGGLLATRIRMTAMPQMVALLNGFGGGASVLVAASALIEGQTVTVAPVRQMLLATVASGMIGALTFFGSIVAFAKLQGLMTERSLMFPGQQWLNALVGLATLMLGAWFFARPFSADTFWFVVAAASLLGIMLTIPIGGADMPVAISLLNSYSGLAAAATGFVLANNVLVIAGSLVGASGIVLTKIMCSAMNRSLLAVLSGFVAVTDREGIQEAGIYTGRVKSAVAEEIAPLLETARRVVILPGYGMAVSQAQHSAAELGKLLEAKGIEVVFAIHPVAGRMPGQMNVLLAEAGVSYDKLKDMDEINPVFPSTDVVIVVGANDVVNPLARTDKSSPIAGMPILEVDKSRTVVVIKRSLSPGFAGVPNPLFAASNTLMLFGDANKMLLDLIHALKQ